jgi:hypothetical protein
LESIIVPAPSLDAQVWFDELQQKAVDVHVGQSDVAGELDRLIPALLHQIFGSVRQPSRAGGRDRSHSAKGTRPSATGDRGFESISLHRRVRCEPDFLDHGWLSLLVVLLLSARDPTAVLLLPAPLISSVDVPGVGP